MNTRTSVLLGSAIAIVWGISACGGDDSAATPDASADTSVDQAMAPVDAGVKDTSVADTGNDVATSACNALGNSAPTIMLQYAPGTPPVGAGGTIADGTYFVTASSIYVGDAGLTGPTGATAKVTQVIAANAYQNVSFEGAVVGTVTENGTYATFADGGIIATITCPIPAPPPHIASYDSDGGTLAVYIAQSDASPGFSLTLTKQ